MKTKYRTAGEYNCYRNYIKNIFLKSSTLFLLSSLMAININADDILTGDAKLACEAILCLSSGKRPEECNPSIEKFFSIHAKKPSELIKKRKNFLKLCPTGDAEGMESIEDNLANMKGDCSADFLNTFVENKTELSAGGGQEKFARINPQMPNYCKGIYNPPSYVCDYKFYKQQDWDNGYTVKEIDKSEYLVTDPKLTFTTTTGNHHLHYIYYKKELINKKCWVE